MRIFLLLVILSCVLIIPSTAQHEADNWYFGISSGLTFVSGVLDVDNNGKLQTLEGCATVSDKKTGELLFYTDGVHVWNRNHVIMKNGTGLYGSYGSTQGALIVPNPGNINEYYLFTVPAWESRYKNLYYSIVSLADTIGEVTSKNIFLIDSVAEKLTGTIDCSGTGYWVLTHHRSKSMIFSYHITAKGIDTVPQVSSYGTTVMDYTVGYMKIAPNNSKLALAVTSKIFYLSLFDFDALSGKVTNARILANGESNNSIYGISFSPNSSKLYATAGKLLFHDYIQSAESFILQYDVNQPTTFSIRNSLNRFGTFDLTYSALQLAPNGKLYIARQGRYIDVITSPDVKGSGCNYLPENQYVTGYCNYGLPNFMEYIFSTTGDVSGPYSGCAPPNAMTLPDSGCMGSTFRFVDYSTYKPKLRNWTFTNGTPSTSTDSVVSVKYLKEGLHQVRLIVSNDKGSDTTYTHAVVFPIPTAKAGADKTVCPNATTQLGDEPVAGNTYKWRPDTNLDNSTIANPLCSPVAGITQYILEVTNTYGCTAYDTVQVTVGSITATVSKDTVLCNGERIQLLASGGSEYEWTPSDGLDNPKIPNPIVSPTVTTTYKVIVSSGTCEDSAFVTITVNPQPTAKAGQDKTLCIGASTEIGEVAQAGNSYSWQPSIGLDDATKANPIASPLMTTQYILTVTGNGGCTANDTVLVTIGTIKAIVSNDTSICEGAKAKLFASGGAKYEWSPSVGLDNSFIATPTANPTSTTRYKVLVSSGTCFDSNFVTVTILPPPNANAGDDKSICIGESVEIGIPAESGNSYAWSPSSGLSSSFTSQTSASPATTTTYTLTVTNPAGCVKLDEVTVAVNPRNERSFTLQPDTVSILPGMQFTTNLNISSGVTDWSVKLNYDPLLMKFNSISNSQAIPDYKKGELLVNGNGGSRSIPITFDAFLPHTSDTIYPVNLAVDSLKISKCEIWSATGNIIMLADYCGKNIRVVSNTGMKYFLTVKEKSIDFGVGLTGNVRLEVFDYVGNSVLVVSDGLIDAGEYSSALDLPLGVYYCRMRAGMYESVRKVLIAR